MFEIPPILPAEKLIAKALKRVSKSKGKGRTRPEKARSLSIAKLNTFSDVLDETLRKYVKAFPTIENLPPFHRELVQILVGVDELKHNLGAIDWCRGQVQRICKDYRREIVASGSISDMTRFRREALGRSASIINQVDPNLRALEATRLLIKEVPSVSADLPTIVVAGAPNVGKSQFVRRVSTARPRVATYPFTTKEISVGFVSVEGSRIQIIDTPGLLDRPREKRNRIERQAASALRHLAHVIVFLIDPTGTCGYPLCYQESLLASLREEFPNVPIIAVDNKADLKPSISSRKRISALTGKGVEQLMNEAIRVATSRAPAAFPPPAA